ncbi:sulfate transporter [Mycobacterium sp. 1164966.3]|nr:sulfate transporter [Mycobacterium sp. 1164966.3]
MSAIADSASSLAIASRTEESAVVLTVDGVLDAANSAALLDSIAKASRKRPPAVIVDVTALRVPDESAWSTFLGARWQHDGRPEVPLLLVCGNRSSREAIERSGVARLLPVYATDKTAMKAVARLSRKKVRRAKAELPAHLSSLRESRQLVREWFTAWSEPGLIPVALVVVNVFIENVLEHTGSQPLMMIECDGRTATIAVSDTSSTPAARLPSPTKGIDVSGLAIVDALSRDWGSTPGASGKTVWAIIGPENQL